MGLAFGVHFVHHARSRSPDILEQVRVAQKRQYDSHLDQIKYAQEEVRRVLSETKLLDSDKVREAYATDLGHFPDGAPVQPSDVGIPLTEGDDDRELAPLPIAGNPQSGVEQPPFPQGPRRGRPPGSKNRAR